MSRGLGQTQRAILAALAGGKHGRSADLAGVVYSTEAPTRAQRESVRRAVAHLEAAGLVTTEVTDEVFSLLPGAREWSRVVRTAPAAEQHLPTGAEVLEARLSQAIDDLQSGRITVAESHRVTKEARREIAVVEAALRGAGPRATLRTPGPQLAGPEQHLDEYAGADGATLSDPGPEQHLEDAAEPVPVVVDHAEAVAESPGDADVPEGAPRRDRWTEVRTARKADHEAGKHGEFVEGCPPCEDDHGRHAGLEEFVGGCADCEAAEEALNAKEEAEYAVRLKAERKAAREEARVRAAWLAANPEAIAWRCAGCDAEFTDADADQGQGALYECGECGNPFSRGNSADGDSNRCPDCNRFGAKLAELACPECGEGDLEPVDPAEQHLEADE